MIKSRILIGVFLVCVGFMHSASAELHVTDYSVGYTNATGTITFDDWGFVGPDGVGANDHQVGAGFDPSQIGQMQRVQTIGPDWFTPDGDSTYTMPEQNKTLENVRDWDYPWQYRFSSNDGQVNFYIWVYTTPSSTFNNMQIDISGNYHIAKEDMHFGFYDRFIYNDVSNDAAIDTTGMTDQEIIDAKTDETLLTDLNFQPYPANDAKGWCGSIMAENPGALEEMAGQVTFDLVMDQCGFGTICSGPTYNSQLIPDYVMRSYGSYDVQVTKGTTLQSYQSSAVINNTNPLTGLVDPDFYNKVSFHGPGVVPEGVWVTKDSYELDGAGDLVLDGGSPVKKLNANNTWAVTMVDVGTPDAQWHINAFAGYAFLLRADGVRIIEAMDYSQYPILTNVPTVLSGVAYNDDENGVSHAIADITGTPTAFTFADQTGVTIDTQVDSDAITITGLTRDTIITVAGGEYSIDGGEFTSVRGAVVNNNSVRLRSTSSSSFSTAVDAVLTIGTVSDTFSVITEALDDIPEAFSFTDQTLVTPGSVRTSDAITVSGINAPVSISVLNDEYSINGGAYTSLDGTVNNGDLVTVRHTSHTSQSAAHTTTVIIGGVYGYFSSYTYDATPNAFSFSDKTDAVLDSHYISWFTVAGINVDTEISITGGGQYSINGGSYTSEQGAVSNSDYIDVQILSSTSPSTTVEAVLTVGGVSDTFSVTTGSDVDGDAVIDIYDNCTNVANADQTDTDGDNYGNACDANFDNDGSDLSNAIDLGLFKADFFTTGPDLHTDLNSDNIVNSLDLGLFKQRFGQPSGPSGLNP